MKGQKMQPPAGGDTRAAADTDANDTEQARFAASSIAHPPAVATPNIASDIHWHPILRPMFVVVEMMLESNHPDAFALLSALATLNGHSAFWTDEVVRP